MSLNRAAVWRRAGAVNTLSQQIALSSRSNCSVRLVSCEKSCSELAGPGTKRFPLTARMVILAGIEAVVACKVSRTSPSGVNPLPLYR